VLSIVFAKESGSCVLSAVSLGGGGGGRGRQGGWVGFGKCWKTTQQQNSNKKQNE